MQGDAAAMTKSDWDEEYREGAEVEERRDAERLDRIFYAQVHGRHGSLRAMILNLSRTGALISIADPSFNATLAKGDLSMLGLRVAALFGEGMNVRFRQAPVTIEAEVVRIDEGRQGDSWVFSMGARFLRQLTPAECSVLGISTHTLPPAKEVGSGGAGGGVGAGGSAGSAATGASGVAPGEGGAAVVGGDARKRPLDDLRPVESEDQESPEESSRFQAMDVNDATRSPSNFTVRLDKAGHEFTIRELLRMATDREASDLHIKAESPVRVRVDGRLMKLGKECLTPEDARALVYDLLTEDQLWEFARRGDLDVAHTLDGKGRFRINVFVTCGQMGMAIRRIPEKVPTIAELGLSPACEVLAERKRGLVLVTGPTGSGKSTTLAAMIHHINKTRPCHIVTMEDPVEYRHREIQAHITQREVGRDTADFASALKRALRQDPDVLMVGEMRDLETVAMAVTAAETGHLVFGTLHTTSAVQTVDRIVDVFPSSQQAQIRMQLSDSLQGVISQVLVPRIGGGIVVAQEVLVATGAVRALIREAKAQQIENMIQTGAQAGMQTLDASLATLASAKLITQESALALARNPARMDGVRLPSPRR
jgi:twitching motility protein PilT